MMVFPAATPEAPTGMFNDVPAALFETVPMLPTKAMELGGMTSKLTAMVWPACILLKVYDVTAPTELPSTSTSSTW
jgi:hypothetical protein